MAPLAPFISEEMYKNLTGNESVHLEEFPAGDKALLNENLISEMTLVRQVVELGHSKRKENSLKLRQPLASVTYSAPDNLPQELEDIIKDELNLKSVQFEKAAELSVELDINLTEDLKKEGQAREIIRNVQKLRKEQGLTLNDQINLIIPEWPAEFEDLIKKSTHAASLIAGAEMKIEVV
jgi:isoleucyl-tRNA synthetase